MCAPSPPPAPDFIGAAQAQGQANKGAAITQGKINNPNVISPYGTQTTEWGTGFDQAGYDKALQKYEQDNKLFWDRWNAWDKGSGGGDGIIDNLPGVGGLFGGGGRGPREGPFDYTAPTAVKREDFILNPEQATIRQQFSPEQQAIFDETNKAKLGLSQLATRGAGAAGDVIGKNVDYSGMPSAPTTGVVNQRVIDAMMGRVNEDYGKATDEKNSALIAAGIRPGSTAYDNSMQLLQRGKNDAAQQAVLAGYQQGGREFEQDTAARRNAIAEYLAQRQTPLNEVTALMSGSQVQNPFSVPGYAQNAQVAAAPLFGATQQAGDWSADLYNAKAAQAGNLQQGLFGLGGAGLKAFAMRP